MGLFGKRKNADEQFKAQLEKEALEKLNSNDVPDYILPFEEQTPSADFPQLGHFGVHAKNVITPEEILASRTTENKPVSSQSNQEETVIAMSKEKPQSSSDFLYEKMTKAREQATKNAIENSVTEAHVIQQEHKSTSSNVPSENKVNEGLSNDTPKAKASKEDLSKPDFESLMKDLHSAAERYTKKAVTETFTDKRVQTEIKPDLPPVANAPQNTTETTSTKSTEGEEAPSSNEAKRASLLARCNAYLNDEELGQAKFDNTEQYRLESVDSILKSMEERAANRTKNGFSIQLEPEKPVPTATLPTKTLTYEELLTELNKNISVTSTETSVAKKDADIDTVEATNDFADAAETDKHGIPKESISETPLENEEDINGTITFDTIKTNEVKHHFVSDVEVAKPEGTQIFPIIESEDTNNNSISDIYSSTETKEYSDFDNDEKEIEEFSSIEDRKQIGKKLSHLTVATTVKALITFVLFVVSLLMLSPLAEEIKAINLATYHGLCLCLVGLGCIINYDIFKSLVDVIKQKFNTDLPFVLSSVAVMGYNVFQLATSSESLTLAPLALLSLLSNACTKASKHKRIYKNFLFVANEHPKKAITILNNNSATKTIVGKKIEGNALVCYGKNTRNITEFVKNSFCKDPNAKKIVYVTIIGAMLGLVISVIGFILSGNLSDFLKILAISYFVLAAPTVIGLTETPVKVASKRLKFYNAMLSGYREASKLDNCNAIAADAKDLFPNGSIRLVDMKALSSNSVYQAILDAIALTENIGSPLAEMFKQAMDAPSDKPLEVDSAVYEDRMGISGWVNDRRVFIGNRILMESHGFTNIPEIELDKKIMRKGYFPIYLAIDGTPCVLFVAKYFADEEITYELKRLCNTGTTVFVKNCDPNISNEMLCDYFGLYEGSINVMSKQGSDLYSVMTEEVESCPGGSVYTDSVCGLFATLTASINIKCLSNVLYILYVICAVLGIFATAIAAFSGLLSALSIWVILAAQLVLTAITFIPVFLKRP